MSICLVMIVRDEAERVARSLLSVRELVDTWLVVDTGSEDETPAKVRWMMQDLPGELLEREWRDFGTNRTEALDLARGRGDWLLMIDAAAEVWHNDGLRDWLASEPDPDVAAWMVEVRYQGTEWRWRAPLLVRGDQEWRYVGPVHEYLDVAGRTTRPLTGLVVTHSADRRERPGKYERYLELLRPGYEAREPRAVYYYARTLQDLDRIPEAIDVYRERYSMNGFEEERWHAGYMAAKLAGDPGDLLASFAERPWRHEPLSEAARIVAADENDDVLFLEVRP